nr:ThiF family adenylyltransferase [Luteibacter rhizovicinus]
MSSSPIARSPDLLRLRNEGFHLEVRAGYLLVHDVPHVTMQRTVARGTLAFRLDLTADIAVKPQEHTAYFIGGSPCDAQGHPLIGIINSSNPTTMNGIAMDHLLSAKPRTADRLYATYYDKVTQYALHLVGPAQCVEPGVNAQTFPIIEADAAESVFVYEDTASTRSGIAVPSDRLKGQRIAIVGLGGTGAHLLDLVVKTPVATIHLWDGDVLQQHNAFRYPGAVPLATLHTSPAKVDYLASVYGAMRHHIMPHPEMITAENVGALRDFDYVFVCVDKSEGRRLILEALPGSTATMIDVGMGVRMNSAQALLGQCRVTVVTPERHPEAIATLPLEGEDDANLYTSNIQVADLNALNAVLAVEAWKKQSGFYASVTPAYLVAYATASSTLATAEPGEAHAPSK